MEALDRDEGDNDDNDDDDDATYRLKRWMWWSKLQGIQKNYSVGQLAK